MNEVIRAAAELQDFCEANAWQYCFIGGVALQRWGEPRETVDADLMLLVGFGSEEPFIELLLRHFRARIPDAAQFALEGRVLLLSAANGVGLDVALAALPFETLMVQRSSIFSYSAEISLRTCSAEDLIILKAFASRTQDWADIEKVIVRQTGFLDWSYIYQQLRPLAELKDSPELMDELAAKQVQFEK